jgi:RND superfamily putative drug exporter
MAGLARWCIRRKNLVVLTWVIVLVGLGGVVAVAGSAFSDATSLPASDSATPPFGLN